MAEQTTRDDGLRGHTLDAARNILPTALAADDGGGFSGGVRHTRRLRPKSVERQTKSETLCLFFAQDFQRPLAENAETGQPAGGYCEYTGTENAGEVGDPCAMKSYIHAPE